MSLGTFFSDVEAKIASLFNGLGKFLASFFDSLFASIAANGGKVLVDAATAAVAAAELQGGSAQDKFAAAQAAVIKVLQAEGIPVVLNAVNGAIEAAVANMKAQAAMPVPSALPAS